MTNHKLEVLEKSYLLKLTAQQQQAARGMILRERDTFTPDDSEIGDSDKKKKIQLNNQEPLQNN